MLDTFKRAIWTCVIIVYTVTQTPIHLDDIEIWNKLPTNSLIDKNVDSMKFLVNNKNYDSIFSFLIFFFFIPFHSFWIGYL